MMHVHDSLAALALRAAFGWLPVLRSGSSTQGGKISHFQISNFHCARNDLRRSPIQLVSSKRTRCAGVERGSNWQMGPGIAVESSCAGGLPMCGRPPGLPSVERFHALSSFTSKPLALQNHRPPQAVQAGCVAPKGKPATRRQAPKTA